MATPVLTGVTPTTIAIIGGGFSGSLVATHLLKTATQPLTLKLVERSAAAGRGIAYGTGERGHLLNVSAGNMSAFPQDPGHLLRWLQHNRTELAALLPEAVNASTFIPRKVYGLYVQSILEEAEATAPSYLRLERVVDEVVSVQPSGSQAVVSLASQGDFWADRVVLALGNSPVVPDGISEDRWGLPPGVLRHAWSADALEDLDPETPVLLVGTGLTMVDMVVLLHDRQHRGPIYALSRRGLTPQCHQASQPYPAFLTPETLPHTTPELVRRVREEVATAAGLGYDWRSVLDSLRPLSQSLWQGLPLNEQARFLRLVAPYWDVHRHRIAPQIAEILDKLRAAGQLTFLAGRIQNYQFADGAVQVAFCPRGRQAIETLRVGRVVTCTGVNVDYGRSTHPLIASLRSQGLIRPNPLGLGIATAANGAVRSATGGESSLLYTLGTPRKGDLWETIAVPELRGQAAALAKTLLRSLPARVLPIPTLGLTRQTAEELAHASSVQSALLFRQFLDPESSTYTYLIADRNTGDAALVDPVLEQVDRDLQTLEDLGLNLRYCLETHLHADHITGAGKLRQKTGCWVFVPKNPAVLKADCALVGGETLVVGTVGIEAIATPGHVDSHIAYWVEQTHLLTGDALFIRGCGRTDFQGGDPGTLYDSVTQRLFTLPNETLVYPGHDYQGRTVSTIGEEKRLNPRFADRTRSQFITIMNNLNLNYPKKMNEAVPANQYCGDFIAQDSIVENSTSSNEEQTIDQTISANTEIYNNYFGMYI